MRRVLTLLFATVALAACSIKWDKDVTPDPTPSPEPDPKPEMGLAAMNNEISRWS